MTTTQHGTIATNMNLKEALEHIDKLEREKAELQATRPIPVQVQWLQCFIKSVRSAPTIPELDKLADEAEAMIQL